MVGSGGFIGAVTWRLRVDRRFTARSMIATGAPGEVPRHGHEEPHLVFTYSGGHRSCADHAPEVTSGVGAIFNPAGVEHEDHFVRPGHFLTIALENQVLEGLELPGAPTFAAGPELERIACGFYGACVSGADNSTLEDLVDEVLHLFAPRLRPRRPEPNLVAAAKARFQEVADAQASVRAVASALDVHPVYLARVFRAAEGRSPGAFRAALRLDRAVDLLRNTKWPIATIAADCGFADQAHLSRCFRVRWRTSPAVFRRSLMV